VEHCTSCDIVSQKTSSVRQDRAMNSAHVFDLRDVRYARIQEHTEVIESTIDRSLMSSDAAKKVFLHANGISKNVGNHVRLLAGFEVPGRSMFTSTLYQPHHISSCMDVLPCFWTRRLRTSQSPRGICSWSVCEQLRRTCPPTPSCPLLSRRRWVAQRSQWPTMSCS